MKYKVNELLVQSRLHSVWPMLRRTLISISIILSLELPLHSQEIPRGFVMPVELSQGFRVPEGATNQLYLAALRIEPMYAFLGNNMRGGVAASAEYTNPQLDWFIGPRLSYRLISNMGAVGSLYNVQVCTEALWGTRDHKLWGLGLVVEGDPIIFSVRGSHEYEFKEFWFEASIGVNLDVFLRKKNEDPFNN
jgi:hypothetical protein